MTSKKLVSLKKIMIFGLPGSGKTRFSIQLGNLLNLPVYHLDRYFFVQNWQERNYEEFLTIQNDLVLKSEWIIDGNATRSLDVRWSEADVVIYFRFNRLLCLWRLIKRVFQKGDVPDLPDDCVKSVRWKLIRYMWTFHGERAELKIEELKKKHPKAAFFVFQGDRDRDLFLKKPELVAQVF